MSKRTIPNGKDDGESSSSLRPTGPRFRCDECGRVITPGTGYLDIDTGPAGAYVRWLALHELPAGGRPQVLRGDEINNHPRRAAWRAVHDDCDDGRRYTYWVPSERIATWPDVIDWSAHLAGKRWVAGTDWNQFLRRQLGPGSEVAA